jgi:hypothetical protein
LDDLDKNLSILVTLWPSFLADGCFGSTPQPPHPPTPPRQEAGPATQSKTEKERGKGVGLKPDHTAARKLGPLEISQSSLVNTVPLQSLLQMSSLTLFFIFICRRNPCTSSTTITTIITGMTLVRQFARGFSNI